MKKLLITLIVLIAGINLFGQVWEDNQAPATIRAAVNAKFVNLSDSLSIIYTVDSVINLLGTADRFFITNASGEVIEVGFGTTGQVLTSGGAIVAPSFEDATGGSGLPLVFNGSDQSVVLDSSQLDYSGYDVSGNISLYVEYSPNNFWVMAGDSSVIGANYSANELKVGSSGLYIYSFDKSQAGNNYWELRADTGDVVIKDYVGGQGIEYFEDYSATFTDRSLPDLAAVRSEISDSISGLAGGHNEVTLASPSYNLSLAGQELTVAQADLTTDVTGVLPDANVANDITITNISQVGDITASATEINYTTDVTSLIQAQLDAKLDEADTVQMNFGDGLDTVYTESGKILTVTWDSTATYAEFAATYKLVDSLSQYQFGAGSGFARDTAVFDTIADGSGAKYGRKFIAVDSIEIYGFQMSLSAGDTLDVLVYYNDSAYIKGAGATIIDTLNITGGDSFIGTTGFSTTTIPKDMYICFEFFSTVDTRNPIWMLGDLIGYIKRD